MQTEKTTKADKKTQVITGFTKENCKMMREEIQTALDQIAEKYGLESIQLGNIGLTSYEFKAPIVAKVKAELNQDLRNMNKVFSESLGYNVNIVGLEFTYRGRTFKILGVNMKRPKYPIEVEDVSDKSKAGFPNSGRLPFTDKSITWERPVNFF